MWKCGRFCSSNNGCFSLFALAGRQLKATAAAVATALAAVCLLLKHRLIKRRECVQKCEHMDGRERTALLSTVNC